MRRLTTRPEDQRGCDGCSELIPSHTTTHQCVHCGLDLCVRCFDAATGAATIIPCRACYVGHIVNGRCSNLRCQPPAPAPAPAPPTLALGSTAHLQAKFTNSPFEHAVFRDFDDSNFKAVYVRGPSSAYKTGSVRERTAWLKQSLAKSAISVDIEEISRGRDGAALSDPDEMALLLWTFQERRCPPADTGEGVFKRVNNALLCDDPDMLEETSYFIRAVTRYIVSHPASRAVKLYRGTKIQEQQMTAVDREGGVGGRVFRQPMFVAASESEDVALGFCEEESPIMEFLVPEGCLNCAEIPKHLSKFPDEQEWLMPPYTPVEWVGQEERSFAGGETRLVVTFQVLDGRVVSEDPRYAGVVRTCMIMCELPQDMRELSRARCQRSALGGGYAGYSPSGGGGGGGRRSVSRVDVYEEYEEGEPPEPEPEPEPEVAPEPALIAWLSRKNLQAYRE
jgi:hypothetical protein